MTVCLLLLSVVALTAAVPAPRALTRAEWPEREPVVGLWVWQCLVATVLLCCLTALVLGAATVFHTVRAQVFAPAPAAVTEAYDLSAASPWAAPQASSRVSAAARPAPTCGSAPPTCRPDCRPPGARCSCWRTNTPTPGGCPATRPS